MCSHVLLQHGGAAFDLIRDSVMKVTVMLFYYCPASCVA